MKQVSHKPDRLVIPGIMFEEQQAVRPMLHQFARFLQRPGVLEIGRDQTSISLQHLANQEEVFLVIAHQEYPQWRHSRFCCC
jgi:hypothetical protein